MIKLYKLKSYKMQTFRHNKYLKPIYFDWTALLYKFLNIKFYGPKIATATV